MPQQTNKNTCFKASKRESCDQSLLVQGDRTSKISPDQFVNICTIPAAVFNCSHDSRPFASFYNPQMFNCKHNKPDLDCRARVHDKVKWTKWGISIMKEQGSNQNAGNIKSKIHFGEYTNQRRNFDHLMRLLWSMHSISRTRQTRSSGCAPVCFRHKRQRQSPGFGTQSARSVVRHSAG